MLLKDNLAVVLNESVGGRSTLPSSGTFEELHGATVKVNALLLSGPPHCNRFQMVLDTMETLNTRGKRSALVRGGSGARGRWTYLSFLLITGV